MDTATKRADVLFVRTMFKEKAGPELPVDIGYWAMDVKDARFSEAAHRLADNAGHAVTKMYPNAEITVERKFLKASVVINFGPGLTGVADEDFVVTVAKGERGVKITSTEFDRSYNSRGADQKERMQAVAAIVKGA